MITKYIENEDSSIQRIDEHEGAVTSHLPVFEGQTRERTDEDGEIEWKDINEVDETKKHLINCILIG